MIFFCFFCCCQTVFTFDGETVKQTLKFENVTGTNVYKFTPDGLTATLTANDKTATRTYKRTEWQLRQFISKLVIATLFIMFAVLESWLIMELVWHIVNFIYYEYLASVLMILLLLNDYWCLMIMMDYVMFGWFFWWWI